MKQLSIITDSRIGVIAEISEALAEKNINIENIDAKSFSDHAVILLSVDQYDLAFQTLNQFNNFQIITEDAILIRLENEPGALAKIARRFTDADIDLRSIRFIQRNEDFGLVAISTDRTEDALNLVKDVLVSYKLVS